MIPPLEPLLSPDQLPSGFKYPREFLRVVHLGLLELQPWEILDGQPLVRRMHELSERYPTRTLVPFFRRQDCDDIACWDIDRPAGTVVTIEDFEPPGWEPIRAFGTFYGWLRSAIDDLIEFDTPPQWLEPATRVQLALNPLVARLLRRDERPSSFEYPSEFLRILDLNLTHIEPWHLLAGSSLRHHARRLWRQNETPKVVPFFRRKDNGSLACWDLDRPQGSVIVVDGETPAVSAECRSYLGFYDWLRQAFEDMIEFDTAAQPPGDMPPSGTKAT